MIPVVKGRWTLHHSCRQLVSIAWQKLAKGLAPGALGAGLTLGGTAFTPGSLEAGPVAVRRAAPAPDWVALEEEARTALGDYFRAFQAVPVSKNPLRDLLLARAGGKGSGFQKPLPAKWTNYTYRWTRSAAYPLLGEVWAEADDGTWRCRVVLWWHAKERYWEPAPRPEFWGYERVAWAGRRPASSR